jgi:integrase/recombinase XerD
MEEREIQRIRRLIIQYREHLKLTGYSERTQELYPGQLRFFVDFLKGEEVGGLADVTREVVYRYQMSLPGQRGRGGGSMTLESQHCRLSILRHFFRYLERQGRVLHDPTSSLELPRRTRHIPRHVITPREMNRLLNQPDADKPRELRDKAMLEVLYSTGIRNAELRHLKVRDVDLGEREVRINDGKGGKDRVTPLGEVAAKYLELYIEEARPRILRTARERSPDFLFISKNGYRLSHTCLSDIINKYAGRARIGRRLTAHQFRHACATHMLRGHADLRHIQALLGHKNIVTTQIYTHVEVGDLKREHRRTHPREQSR